MKKGANSGKQQRLKLKVARSTQRSTTTRIPGANLSIEHEAAHDFRLKGVPADLYTVFHVREAQYEVDKRVNAARQPLGARVDMQTHDGQLYQETISIPLRPAWTASMKAKRVQAQEEEAFEAYLSDIYKRYPPHRLNHFEHNINVWRQLWRVCEMADALILSADARHPLFHFPPSLYHYVTVTLHKPLVLLVNKVDLVDGDTLQGWVRYFRWKYPAVRVVCFSSNANGEQVVSGVMDVEQRVKERRKETGKNKAVSGVEDVMEILEQMADDKQRRVAAASGADVGQSGASKNEDGARSRRGRAREREVLDEEKDAVAELKEQPTEFSQVETEEREQEGERQTTVLADNAAPADDELGLPARTTVRTRRMQRAGRAEAAAQRPPVQAAEPNEQAESEAVEEEEPEDELYDLRPAAARPTRDSILVVGVIGHPNAGKSSFINSLFGRPVVSASDTPGHTKHLQSLALTSGIAIVDCPGLVFPAVDMPRPLQVLCGIFPVQQLREPYSSIAYLAERVPLDRIYKLDRVVEDEQRGNAQSADRLRLRRRGRKGEGDGSGEDEVAAEVGGLMLEKQQEDWSAWELCEAYARQRNHTVKGSNGRADTHLAANQILQDVLHGVIVFHFKAPAVPVAKT